MLSSLGLTPLARRIAQVRQPPRGLCLRELGVLAIRYRSTSTSTRGGARSLA